MVTRILVEKRSGFNVEAVALKEEIMRNLHIEGIKKLRIINCYDMEGVSEEALDQIVNTILSEPNVDHVCQDSFELMQGEQAFRYALLPGQYDQRADSAAQCIEIVTLHQRPEIQTSRIIVLEGEIEKEAIENIKRFLINPVEAHEVSLDRPETLKMMGTAPDTVETIADFIDFDKKALEAFRMSMGFAMTGADLEHVQNYFSQEKRNPTITELKVIDTYWSDHCRHTTFMTELEDIKIEEDTFTAPIKEALESYFKMRDDVYGETNRPLSLMDLATINMKSLRKNGKLDDLDVSDEINACSIKIDVDVDGNDEPWLLMFKNETHNHPTEIEPYGGAATCLGGAIRDPLSGRSYVYQSMRVTGAGNPFTPFEDTLEGKLPQKVITQKAAAGFSAYGNQIGLATGLVSEVYHDGFVAKRMEVGAVMGATPFINVVRETPVAGDLIVLIGGRTGRDGVGGATGSSKAHDEDSLLDCGAEVQKGNAPEERKIQRLFRNPALSTKIKKCNDFGAGGVSVAIGELADSLTIDLDKIPKKYEGLDGTELAISESQERMAIVINPSDLEFVTQACGVENLEATVVAKVSDNGRLVMTWHGKNILDLSRAFLDTNGVRAKNKVVIQAPSDHASFFKVEEIKAYDDYLLKQLSSLNVCSQKGLVERFDNTIGAGTVVMPFGGQYLHTPSQAMVAKLPVIGGETNTVSLMSYGYHPMVGNWSPFHGGVYAIVESIAKLVASGGDYKKARLSLQEYFEKLGSHPEKWGKPLAALLGASLAQSAFGTAAIGGKDSMSGTFKDLDVPPTLISFAVTYGKHQEIITPELKKTDSYIVLFDAKRDEHEMPDFEALKTAYDSILEGIKRGEIISAYAVGEGGVATALSKMAFGNKIGFSIDSDLGAKMFEANLGSLVLEVTGSSDQINSLSASQFNWIGRTTTQFEFILHGSKVDGDKALVSFISPMESVFPTVHGGKGKVEKVSCHERITHKPKITTLKPRVFIPVFPGTNCEYDTARAFEKAGAEVDTLVFRNLTPKDVNESVKAFAESIKKAQIIALPGGFSAGDEPEGSGKFIASVLRNPEIAEAVMTLLKQRDGLMLGICNGFQALVKLGLLPYGEIRSLQEDAPTLTFNKIGRHVARMANVRVSSVHSPWMADANVGEVYQTAFSHGEGRFFASDELVRQLIKKGQIATQYVDDEGNPTYDGHFNLNGSVEAIEGIFSEDGRIFGKMGHVERMGNGLYKNIYGEKEFDIFKSGVKYFK